MTKKEIIDIADEFVQNSKFNQVVGDRDNIGTNQFRSIASACKAAECYEEIEILIKYNTAKDDNKSWIKIQDDLLNSMDKIKSEDNENVLANLNLFFGYLYRYGRINASIHKEKG
ncbi:MAG: hypothetical protein ACI4I6_03990 [Hominimerdicola sp.]